MEEIKDRAKEEVKEGIAEALEELGTELKGGESQEEKLDRKVSSGPGINSILNRVQSGAMKEEMEEEEDEEKDSSKLKDRSRRETEDEEGSEEKDEEIDIEEDETEIEDRFDDEEGLEEIPISEPEVSDIEEIEMPGKEEPEEEKSESDDAEDEENDRNRSEVVKNILERLRDGLNYSYRGDEDRGRKLKEASQISEGDQGGTQGDTDLRKPRRAPRRGAPGGRSQGRVEGGQGSGGSTESEDSDVESYVFENATKKEGTKLPQTGWEGSSSIDLGKSGEEKKLTEIDEYYSLIPKNPDPDEDIYAYAHITWDEENNSLVYRVTEPNLSDKDQELLQRIKNNIEDRLDVDFDEVGKIKARGYISNKLDEVLEMLGKDISGIRKKAIRYYLERDFVDMGKIEPLMRDPNIEEISCDGVDIPIFVYHRNAKYGSLETNITFENSEELDQYVMRLGQKVGKTVSMSKPLVDASLPDGSRLQATLGTDIARKGSNFTIRKFTENPLTPTDLIEFETIDPRTLAYLWMAIEHQNSVLISGGTATGKTTMLNVISLFIKPEMKIVTIEDTAELRLPHDHWVPEVAREAMSSEESDTVDMFDLLKESLRQRPDYIVVGEVRGAEAFVLFQQMSTGHPGLATIHAENPERLISRLTTKPIDLPPSLLSALDIVIFLRKVRKGDSLVRKVDQIVEVKRFSREENVPKMNRVFKWDPEEDELVNENPSLILKEISKLKGMDGEDLRREINDRERIIEWMVHEGMRNLETIGNVLSKYYSEKESLLEKIESSG